jgi:Fe-Mn family superoxide dismutase
MKLLKILETTSKKLGLIKLSVGKSSMEPVLSKKNLDLHYNKLAQGYVDRYNNHEGDPVFNQAGAFLHNIYFEQMHEPNNDPPSGKLEELIVKKFKTFEKMQDAFEKELGSLQGSGWLYLSKTGDIKVIHNHEVKHDIALLIDMWEHAFIQDYGSDKKKYLKNHWRIISWEVVSSRL